MLQVKTAGAGPNMFTGAHHLSIENGDFRIAGRDMYNTPTVNVNITTPTSEYATNRARVALVRAPTSHTAPGPVQAQGGRALWSRRIVRFLRSRSGHGNTAYDEPLQVGATAQNWRSTANETKGGDLTVVCRDDAIYLLNCFAHLALTTVVN